MEIKSITKIFEEIKEGMEYENKQIEALQKWLIEMETRVKKLENDTSGEKIHRGKVIHDHCEDEWDTYYIGQEDIESILFTIL